MRKKLGKEEGSEYEVEFLNHSDNAKRGSYSSNLGRKLTCASVWEDAVEISRTSIKRSSRVKSVEGLDMLCTSK